MIFLLEEVCAPTAFEWVMKNHALLRHNEVDHMAEKVFCMEWGHEIEVELMGHIADSLAEYYSYVCSEF